MNARRPLQSREASIAKKLAQQLSRQNITPNQISIASLFFALLSACCFVWLDSTNQNAHWWLLLLAAIFIQCRLLCNLFDGMVAIEGAKSTKSGELFNDIPDRIADSLILIAAGYAITTVSWGSEIGWCASLLAVMTAYLRTLGASVGAPVNFQGPMAKPHRMAVLTVACIATTIEGYVYGSHYALLLALLVIVIGSFITCIRRAITTYRYLEA